MRIFNSRLLLLIAPIITLLVAACSALPKAVETAESPKLQTTLLFSRDVIRDRGPIGVNERFTIDGSIVAYATFTWDDVSKAAGKQKIETRWYSGDKLVYQRENDFTFGKPPYHVWSRMQAATLGAGNSRFEIYVNGVLAAKKYVEIIDRSQITNELPLPKT
jgi:hypothetical protein